MVNSLVITAPGAITNPAGAPIYVPPIAITPQPTHRYMTRHLIEASGAPCGTLTDLVGSLPLTAAGSGSSPLVSVESVTGFKTLTFDGVDDRLFNTGSFTYTGDLTLMIVARLVATGQNNRVIIDATNRRINTSSTGLIGTFGPSGGGASLSGGQDTLWHFLACRFTSSDSAVWRDATKSTGSAVGAGTASTITVNQGVGFNTNMEVAEAAVFQTAVSDADMALARADFKSRYSFLP